MKNLSKLTEVIDDISIDHQLKLFTVDHINGLVFIVTVDNQFVTYNPATKKVQQRIDLNDQGILSDGASVISIEFIPDLDAICMASDKGDILMYTITAALLECVGIVGSGITCMAWSPDFELFILATESDTLVQMTKDWDILNEVPINTDLQSKPKIFVPTSITTHITPATTNASTIAAAENAAKTSNFIEIPLDQRLPSISWRGDGQFFTVSSYNPEVKRFQIRVWERSLVLHSMSEPIETGLEGKIHWRPNGSLIAASQRFAAEQRHDISFFERNGLKHGEFTIRGKYDLRSIQWSSDSEILALHLTRQDEKKASVVQLWHRSNYHWFLKQELIFDEAQEVSHMLWDQSTTSSVLRIITRQHRYHEIKFCWDYDVSPGYSAENPSIVSMVDGALLKMTPFRRLVVPPPMSAYQIQLLDNCLQFSFNPATYQLMVFTSDGSIAIYTPATLPPIPQRQTTLPPPNYAVAPSLTSSAQKQSSLKLHQLRHLVWLNENTFVCVESTSNSSDSIVQVQFSVSGDKIVIEEVRHSPAPGKVLRLISQVDSASIERLYEDRVLFETIDGSVYIYNSISLLYAPFISLSQETSFKFTTPCLWISSVLVNGEDSIVGLNDRSKLYINQNLVSNDCNSFVIHNRFLMFTTLSHVLRSVPLALPPPTTPLVYQQPVIQAQQHNPKFPPPQNTNYDDSIREVERGSKIVVVVPHDTRLVLQMPRGNLEAISPRSLTLSTIRELLNAHQYEKAFSLMRRNRVDMNFIYDHNPADFIAHIEDFINQVAQIDYLNLFISSLRDEDTSKTLFIDLERPKEPTTTLKKQDNSGKVNLVCDKLRQVLVKKDSIKFNLPILTTYVKKSPPELDQVLRLIQSLRGEETNDQGETVINRLTEESLDYIVFLVDVNKLYDIALGTYDFELVIMVAQKSQKDPKEYMGFLTDLQKMEKYYQRYSIDVYLSRWPSALENLSMAGDEYFEDCCSMVKQHKIYKEAVQIYSKKANAKQLAQIQIIYADYLMQSNSYEEAAFLYSSAGDYLKACQAFKDAGLWELSLLQTIHLSYNPEQSKNFCLELAETLKRLSKYSEAAKVLTHPSCMEIEAAIHAYTEGFYWTDAYILAVSNNLDVKQLIYEQLIECHTNQLTEIQENMDTYDKSYQRIQIVRQNKLNFVPLILPKSALDAETSSMMSGMSGMFSEGAGSVSSQMSTSSYVSTYSSQTGTFSKATKSRVKKNKQKPRKQRVTGKEGSQFEEEYLVDEMKKMIPSPNSQQTIGRIVKGLVLFNEFSKAKEIQQLYQKFLDLIDESLDALSASATAVNSDNKKEKEREYEYLAKQQDQLANNIPIDPNQKPFVLNVKQIIISREKSNWNLNIF